jgi:hypothetical protein
MPASIMWDVLVPPGIRNGTSKAERAKGHGGTTIVTRALPPTVDRQRLAERSGLG